MPVFPQLRLRRLRRTETIRALVRENHVDVGDLIYPMFVVEGKGIVAEIPSMPRINLFSPDRLAAEMEEIAKLKIPAGSQTGQVFRLKGKGFPHLRGSGHGDPLVTLLVVTPDSLSEKQRQLFQELGNSLNSANMPNPKKWRGFLDRLKHTFSA